MRTLVSLHSFTYALTAALGLTGCGGSTTDSSTASSGGGPGSGGGSAVSPFPCRNPTPALDANGAPTGLVDCEGATSQRVQAVACEVSVPRTGVLCESYSPTDDTCQTDAECTEQPFGYCAPQGQIGYCGCSYGCAEDADCAGGGVCRCGGPAGYCVEATCRTSNDCSGALECRSNQNPESSLCGDQRFECQTPQDECETDADCNTGGYAMCVADAAGVHRCNGEFSCGVPGRPYLVDGAAVTACVVRRDDWAGAIPSAALTALGDADRRALAEYYSDMALMEHAAVAAFARFALQLLALGAPPDLVDGAQRAMADELAHARVCFGLASRYAGVALGPSPLPLGDSLGACDLETVLRLAVREGCIGETVAAVEAAEALEHARDPQVRIALGRIVEDETRHAELAYRFARWALEQEPALARVVVEEVERDVAARTDEAPEDSRAPEALAAHGLLPEPHRRALAARAVREVVGPVIARLLDSAAPSRAA